MDRVNKYLNQIRTRADHHAPKVRVAWKVVAAEVLSRGGELLTYRAVVSKVALYGRVLYFGYDHERQAIIVRENNQQGKLLITFDNKNVHAMIPGFFNTLEEEYKNQ